jgi:serine/threonine protein kinase
MGGCISCKNDTDAKNADSASNKPTTFNEKLFRTVDFKLITTTYTITPTILGFGNFGKVFLAHHNVNSKFRVAVKTISKKKIQKGNGSMDKLK